MSYFADGVALDSIAHWVGIESRPHSAPGAKGSNLRVPARHGALWFPKTFDENEIALVIQVVGSGIDSVAELVSAQSAIRSLLRIFTKRSSLVHLRRVLPDGSQIECYAECSDPVDITRTSDELPYARMEIPLRIPDAFWRDTADVTWTSSAGIVANQAFVMPPFEGGSAPMDDGIYLVHGPADDPELRVVETGAYVRLDANLAGGSTWRINAETWESVTGVGIGFAGTTGLTNVIGSTVHGGSAAFVDLPALGAGDLGLEFSGANLGAATQIEARGRRKYTSSA